MNKIYITYTTFWRKYILYTFTYILHIYFFVRATPVNRRYTVLLLLSLLLSLDDFFTFAIFVVRYDSGLRIARGDAGARHSRAIHGIVTLYHFTTRATLGLTISRWFRNGAHLTVYRTLPTRSFSFAAPANVKTQIKICGLGNMEK